MKKCKWCREEVIPGTLEGWPWMHATGFYSCSWVNKKIAEPADERWESVRAYMGEPTKKPLYDAVEISISIPAIARGFYTTEWIPKEQIEHAAFDLVYSTLDSMIERLDRYMEENGAPRDG